MALEQATRHIEQAVKEVEAATSAESRLAASKKCYRAVWELRGALRDVRALGPLRENSAQAKAWDALEALLGARGLLYAAARGLHELCGECSTSVLPVAAKKTQNRSVGSRARPRRSAPLRAHGDRLGPATLGEARVRLLKHGAKAPEGCARAAALRACSRRARGGEARRRARGARGVPRARFATRRRRALARRGASRAADEAEAKKTKGGGAETARPPPKPSGLKLSRSTSGGEVAQRGAVARSVRPRESTARSSSWTTSSSSAASIWPRTASTRVWMSRAPAGRRSRRTSRPRRAPRRAPRRRARDDGDKAKGGDAAAGSPRPEGSTRMARLRQSVQGGSPAAAADAPKKRSAFAPGALRLGPGGTRVIRRRFNDDDDAAAAARCALGRELRKRLGAAPERFQRATLRRRCSGSSAGGKKRVRTPVRMCALHGAATLAATLLRSFDAGAAGPSRALVDEALAVAEGLVMRQFDALLRGVGPQRAREALAFLDVERLPAARVDARLVDAAKNAAGALQGRSSRQRSGAIDALSRALTHALTPPKSGLMSSEEDRRRRERRHATAAANACARAPGDFGRAAAGVGASPRRRDGGPLRAGEDRVDVAAERRAPGRPGESFSRGVAALPPRGRERDGGFVCRLEEPKAKLAAAKALADACGKADAPRSEPDAARGARRRRRPSATSRERRPEAPAARAVARALCLKALDGGLGRATRARAPRGAGRALPARSRRARARARAADAAARGLEALADARPDASSGDAGAVPWLLLADACVPPARRARGATADAASVVRAACEAFGDAAWLPPAPEVRPEAGGDEAEEDEAKAPRRCARAGRPAAPRTAAPRPAAPRFGGAAAANDRADRGARTGVARARADTEAGAKQPPPEAPTLEPLPDAVALRADALVRLAARWPPRSSATHGLGALQASGLDLVAALVGRLGAVADPDAPDDAALLQQYASQLGAAARAV
ncbi:hypothetical protein SO694_00075188 [Aureococcus anophagefferens]|uniref:Uncharacterized protein n=1 Tax=Aureococcus anophagefferens TaxID=44056 RepID=A0ABR1FHC6_AURAN